MLKNLCANHYLADFVSRSEPSIIANQIYMHTYMHAYIHIYLNKMNLRTLSKDQTIVAIKFTPIISRNNIGKHIVNKSTEFGVGRQSRGGLVNVL